MNHWIASSVERVGIRAEIKQSSPLQPQSFQKHRHSSSPNAITIITLLTRLEVGRGEIFEQGARKGRAKRNDAGSFLPAVATCLDYLQQMRSRKAIGDGLEVKI